MSKIKILSKTDKPIHIMYTAARTCQSSEAPEDIFLQEPNVNLIAKVLKAGHLSIAEHVNFTFSISGISRACSHQFVRHRLMTVSQQSQKFVKFKYDFVVPDTIKNTYLEQTFISSMNNIFELYEDLLEQNVPTEDARFALPNACKTNMVVTMNLRELMHIANLRLCTNAQWEIRDVVEKMCTLVSVEDTWLCDFLHAKCVKNGYCDEINSCGKYPRRTDEQN